MSAKPGNVLVIAESEKAAERLAHSIRAAGGRPVLVHGPDIGIFERGAESTIDLVVTDLDPALPEGRSILDKLLRGDLFPGVPRMHLLPADLPDGEWDRALADRASVTLPARTDSNAFRNHLRLGTEVGRLRRALARSALRDALTGSYNRHHLVTRLEQEFSRARRYETPLSFVLLELDHLEQIRERYGAEAADRALLHVHRVVGPHVRKENTHGRWGEASLAVLLPGSAYRGAAVFANRVRSEAAASTLAFDRETTRVRLSAGISAHELNRGARSATELIQAAEEALIAARQRGGDRVHIDSELMDGERRLILLADVDVALADPAEDLLTMDGYQVLRAGTTEALLAAVRERAPDLLVIDLQLVHVGTDGHSLLDQVRACTAAHPLRVVGVAGPDYPSQPAHGKRPHVDRYLTKPFSASVLRSLAHDLLEHSTLERGASRRRV